MKGSSNGHVRSVSSESAQWCGSNGNGNRSSLALDVSKPEGLNFVTGSEGKNTNANTNANANANAETAPKTGMETITAAAALLWKKGSMTTAPLKTSSWSLASALSSSNGRSDDKPKPNSPASNAAAALLVGMSMRKEREANNNNNNNSNNNTIFLDPEPANQHAATVSAAASTETADNPSEDEGENKPVDVESKWREIRQKISQQTQAVAAKPGDRPEPNGLELPKGVTRRPSGAWQAQIYFAGKTRYIGVWEKPQQAATAYNLAKEALKDVKAQQKNFRKRQRQLMINTTVVKTPSKESDSQSQHLPPSITWPSSASSSSTISSAGFQSPPSRGPFKKRRGNDLSPASAEPKAPFETCFSLSLLQRQQQGLEQAAAAVAAPLPPPRGHHYSAFSQHFHQQQRMGGPNNGNCNNHPHSNLTHPALQLLSLRPPQQPLHVPVPTTLWMHPPPPYHHPQHYHQQHRPRHPHALHQFPYSQPTMPNNNNGRNNHPAEMQGCATAMAKGARKAAKNKRSKPSAKKAKPIKAAANNSSSANNNVAKNKTERDTLKWKTIRAEVLALFDESKKKRILEEKNASGDWLHSGGGSKEQPTKTFDKEVLRGITVRPSGKFQAQLYFGGRSRYIGVFDSEYEAASAYEKIRSRLKNDPKKTATLPPSSTLTSSSTISTVVSVEVDVCKEGKVDPKESAAAAATAELATAAMRSITPSPTPRNDDSQREAPKIRTA